VAFSWVLIGLGLLMIPYARWDGCVLFIIGLFLKSAAESGYTNTLYHEVLAGVRVHEIMTRDVVCIPAHLPLSLVVDEFFMAKNYIAYPVVGDDMEFRGMLRLEYVREAPREKWPWTTAGEVAAAHDPGGASIDAQAQAEHAMRRLLSGTHGRLAVIEDGRVTGILTRHDLLKYITIHSELRDGRS
jgi:predicted transcriptional regulator